MVVGRSVVVGVGLVVVVEGRSVVVGVGLVVVGVGLVAVLVVVGVGLVAVLVVVGPLLCLPFLSVEAKFHNELETFFPPLFLP